MSMTFIEEGVSETPNKINQIIIKVHPVKLCVQSDKCRGLLKEKSIKDSEDVSM